MDGSAVAFKWRSDRSTRRLGRCCSVSFLMSMIIFEDSTADCCVVSCCGVVLLFVLLRDVLYFMTTDGYVVAPPAGVVVVLLCVSSIFILLFCFLLWPPLDGAIFLFRCRWHLTFNMLSLCFGMTVRTTGTPHHHQGPQS